MDSKLASQSLDGYPQSTSCCCSDQNSRGEEATPRPAAGGADLSVPQRRQVHRNASGKTPRRRKVRYFKSKGALCVLIWSAIFFSTGNVYTSSELLGIGYWYRFYSYSVSLTLYVFPAAVADLWLGRHRVMIWGTTVTWLALIVVSIGTAYKFPNLSSVFPISWILLVNVGRILFQSNVIQFGADQLPEGSSDELSSFVHWFVFSMELGRALGFVMSNFILTSLPWFPFALAAVFSLLLVLLHCCSDSCFSKEPPNKSAYSTIYQVLKYAWKHKFPERRAFMYWDEKPPSRMDLGKGCNGGPFTSEQVEDVKAFLRLLGKILIFLGILISFLDHFFFIETYGVLYVHLGLNESSILPKIASGKLITAAVCFVYVPLHEFVAIPFFRKYVPNILKRIWVAFFLYITSSVVCLIIDVVGHSTTPHNATCFLHEETGPIISVSVSPYLILVPNLLTAFAYIVAYISSFEFILAQAPVAFRGLCMGLFFTTFGCGSMFGSVAIILPIHGSSYFHTTGPSELSCGSLYFLLNTLVGTGGLVFFTVVVLQYKYRERGGSTQHTSYGEREGIWSQR